jgi:S-adenosyl-L-methionine hydrolase (adenosine-forming)
MNRIITLTTDFGLSDGFVGVMKGVILSIAPEAIIVDITHDIAPQDIRQGAFLFAASARYFPANAIHVVVVDPGVGSARRPIAIQVGENFFVAPDNGVLSLALGDAKIRAVHLNRPEFWLPRVSRTFHGRDIFAPIAAHLARGVPLESLGDAIDDYVRLDLPRATRDANGAITGTIIHIDRFGNLITNIGEELFEGLDRAPLRVCIGEKMIQGIRQTYADGAKGEAIALISSSWQLEIAVREGNAAAMLGVQIGERVVVR